MKGVQANAARIRGVNRGYTKVEIMGRAIQPGFELLPGWHCLK